MLNKLLTSPKSYPEDFKHENGNYMNVCNHCRERFLGHKRRYVCKECNEMLKNAITDSSTPPAPDTTAEEILVKHLDKQDAEYGRFPAPFKETVLAAMTDYANQKQREVAVAFAQWSYGLKRIVNEESFHYWLTNIYNK